MFGAEFLIGFGIGMLISGAAIAFRPVSERIGNFWKKLG